MSTPPQLLLDGISVSGFRSFYGGRAELSGLSKINFLIGQNNSGKSNILRFLLEHTGSDENWRQKKKRDDIDSPQGVDAAHLEIGILLRRDSALVDRIFENFKSNKQKALQLIFGDKNDVWYYLGYDAEERLFRSTGKALEQTTKQILIDNQTWSILLSMLGSGGGTLPQWQQHVINKLDPRGHLRFKVDLIPSFRSLTYRIENPDDRLHSLLKHGGMGLIDELFKSQNPDIGAEKDRRRFEKIQTLFCEITGKNDASLEIPHDKSKIIVNMDRRRLPLAALGSGVEELIIIAATSTMFDNQLVLIEEPELHLHPSLQKKLIRYLFNDTTNQYFIATHSMAMLDAAPCSVYHIRLNEGRSVVSRALTSSERFSICVDLGCKASDLLQANSIIWVEGPSDRIYLKHWIKSLREDLVEGLHYSIMFYGGRLLTHLSAEDKEIEEFISLPRLNRQMCIVIDSDRAKKGGRLNATKLRVRREFTEAGCIAWITAGREMENYVKGSIFAEAVRSVHPRVRKVGEWSRYGQMTRLEVGKGLGRIDKVKVAHQVAARQANLSVLDLGDRVKELAEFIDSANGLNI